MDIQKLKRNLSQIPGWHTNRRIVVIESDDWGSIRMSSKKGYNAMLNAGIAVDQDPYSRFDSLESKDDLSALFEVLKKFKDKNGNHPIITANTIVANPDFEKIAASNFETYHYELFTKTLEHYHSDGTTFDVWQEGVKEKLLRPQFHGREHVNVEMWLKSLQGNNAEMQLAFDHKMFGIPTSKQENKRGNFMASFDYQNKDEKENNIEIFNDGLNIFENIFKLKSKTFIAPCYLWDSTIEKAANNRGVIAFQGIPYQYIPSNNKDCYEKKLHFTGSKNKFDQIYLVRNTFFEPSLVSKKHELGSIIKRIETLFLWNKPVIIGSHRINYIGSLNEKNRTQNLFYLKDLLNVIVTKWPNVEFMSSDELAEIIIKK